MPPFSHEDDQRGSDFEFAKHRTPCLRPECRRSRHDPGMQRHRRFSAVFEGWR
jgi:hypothetical protein